MFKRQLALVSVRNADKIRPVLDNDEQRDNPAHDGAKNGGALALLIHENAEHPGQNRHKADADDRAERDHAPYGDHDQENAEADQRNPPVEHQKHAEDREHALAAAEAEIERIEVTEDDEQSRRIGRDQRQRGRLDRYGRRGKMPDAQLGEPAGKQHRAGAFDQVARRGQHGGPNALRAQHVCRARIAAAVVADVVMGEVAGDEDGKIDTAEQIGEQSRERQYKPARLPQLRRDRRGRTAAQQIIHRRILPFCYFPERSPRSRITRRIGVPSSPNASRS